MENDINANNEPETSSSRNMFLGRRFTLKRNFKVLNLNVCGILSKLYNDVFITECKSYDILCFTESKLNDVDNEKVAETFDAAGFKVFFNNRSGISRIRSGEIMIACKKEMMEFVEECNVISKFVK